MAKTRKTKQAVVGSFKQEVVKVFLQILNTVKLYHWKTKSFAIHKATDELYSKLGSNIDSFIEVLLGKEEERIYLPGSSSLSLLDFNSLSDFKKEINIFKNFLIRLNQTLASPINSDLLTIRDEMLKDINQFLYLSTFI
jgi:DNA-binding ferritin-like protein